MEDILNGKKYRLIQGDCLEVMKQFPDNYFDACITDPPYGIGAGSMNLGFSQSSRMDKHNWDEKKPSSRYFVRLREISKHQIIWGGNYFVLPPSRGFYIWDKGAGFKNRSFSECEFAWVSDDVPARIYERNPLACGDYKNRLHKTQKPLALMRWCIKQLPENVETIIDPFMGSGTTGVACAQLGRRFVGIELDPDYFAIAKKRIENAYAQPTLFEKLPPKGDTAVQSNLL